MRLRVTSGAGGVVIPAAPELTGGYRMAKTLPALALALTVLSAPAFAQSVDTQSASRTVISSQIDAFRAEDGARAYSFAAPNVKRFVRTPEAFMGMVRKGYEPVYNPRSYTFGRFLARDSQLFQEVLITGPKGKEWVALYTLQVQADGSVLITSCRLAAHDARSI